MDFARAYQLISPHEGNVPWIYRCTAGRVTVGVGCVLQSPEVAASLAFVVGDRPATETEIVSGYHAVAAMPPGLRSAAYRPANQGLELPADAISRLFEGRVRIFLRSLARSFQDFEQWPEPAQLATLDWVFNCGVGALMATHHLAPALSRHDWTTAAAACHRAASSEDRNDQTRDLYLEAARAS